MNIILLQFTFVSSYKTIFQSIDLLGPPLLLRLPYLLSPLLIPHPSFTLCCSLEWANDWLAGHRSPGLILRIQVRAVHITDCWCSFRLLLRIVSENRWQRWDDDENTSAPKFMIAHWSFKGMRWGGDSTKRHQVGEGRFLWANIKSQSQSKGRGHV